MHGNLPTGLARAIEGAPACESETASTLGSESDADDWFFEAAQGLLGKDAGFALHLITGYPASSCYAYTASNAAKRRKPPEHFLRRLFGRPEGRPFFNAFMAACRSPFWPEYQRAIRIAEAIAAVE
jgi:hypothetical protein